MSDVSTQFRNAIHSTGMIPPDVITPGNLQRFPGAGKSSGNRSGWCILFEDESGGCFGDWSSGLSSHWFSSRCKSRSSVERVARMRQTFAARLQANQTQQDRHKDAANRAIRIWEAAPASPPNHAYLIAKCIQPHNARIHHGSLILPVTTFEGPISSLQFISANGRKRLLSGGRKRGCFITVAGNEEHTQRVIICEGWATGCTLAKDEPGAMVLAAIDAGNMQAVAVAARHRWPSAELVIAGDDDRLTPGNPGATKAHKAALAANALLALPQWPRDAPDHLTDFNDLTLWLTGGDE